MSLDSDCQPPVPLPRLKKKSALKISGLKCKAPERPPPPLPLLQPKSSPITITSPDSPAFRIDIQQTNKKGNSVDGLQAESHSTEGENPYNDYLLPDVTKVSNSLLSSSRPPSRQGSFNAKQWSKIINGPDNELEPTEWAMLRSKETEELLEVSHDRIGEVYSIRSTPSPQPYCQSEDFHASLDPQLSTNSSLTLFHSACVTPECLTHEVQPYSKNNLKEFPKEFNDRKMSLLEQKSFELKWELEKALEECTKVGFLVNDVEERKLWSDVKRDFIEQEASFAVEETIVLEAKEIESEAVVGEAISLTSGSENEGTFAKSPFISVEHLTLEKDSCAETETLLSKFSGNAMDLATEDSLEVSDVISDGIEVLPSFITVLDTHETTVEAIVKEKIESTLMLDKTALYNNMVKENSFCLPSCNILTDIDAVVGGKTEVICSEVPIKIIDVECTPYQEDVKEIAAMCSNTGGETNQVTRESTLGAEEKPIKEIVSIMCGDVSGEPNQDNGDSNRDNKKELMASLEMSESCNSMHHSNQELRVKNGPNIVNVVHKPSVPLGATNTIRKVFQNKADNTGLKKSGYGDFLEELSAVLGHVVKKNSVESPKQLLDAGESSESAALKNNYCNPEVLKKRNQLENIEIGAVKKEEESSVNEINNPALFSETDLKPKKCYKALEDLTNLALTAGNSARVDDDSSIKDLAVEKLADNKSLDSQKSLLNIEREKACNKKVPDLCLNSPRPSNLMGPRPYHVFLESYSLRQEQQKKEMHNKYSLGLHFSLGVEKSCTENSNSSASIMCNADNDEILSRSESIRKKELAAPTECRLPDSLTDLSCIVSCTENLFNSCIHEIPHSLQESHNGSTEERKFSDIMTEVSSETLVVASETCMGIREATSVAEPTENNFDVLFEDQDSLDEASGNDSTTIGKAQCCDDNLLLSEHVLEATSVSVLASPDEKLNCLLDNDIPPVSVGFTVTPHYGCLEYGEEFVSKLTISSNVADIFCDKKGETSTSAKKNCFSEKDDSLPALNQSSGSIEFCHEVEIESLGVIYNSEAGGAELKISDENPQFIETDPQASSKEILSNTSSEEIMIRTPSPLRPAASNLTKVIPKVTITPCLKSQWHSQVITMGSPEPRDELLDPSDLWLKKMYHKELNEMPEQEEVWSDPQAKKKVRFLDAVERIPSTGYDSDVEDSSDDEMPLPKRCETPPSHDIVIYQRKVDCKEYDLEDANKKVALQGKVPSPPDSNGSSCNWKASFLLQI